MLKPSPRSKLSPATQGVLIVMIDHHIGNLLVSLPVINALAAHFQEPPDVLVDARCAPLAAMLPARVKVLSYPAQVGARRSAGRTLSALGFIARLALRRYRLVIDLGGGTRSAVLSAGTLARRRIGFAGLPKSRLYNRRVERDMSGHILDAYASMLEVVGRTGRPPLVRLRAGPDAATALDQVVAERQPDPAAPLAVIHAGTGKAFRQWPPERFAAVADALIERRGMNVCVIGSPSEQPLMDAIVGLMQHRGAAFTLSVPLEQVLALFDRAAILISNESGPTHLAAATDLPIVTIFGPSKETLWRPTRQENTIVLRGAECDPRCGKRRCLAEQRCLLTLTPQAVLGAAERLLESPRAPVEWARPPASPH